MSFKINFFIRPIDTGYRLQWEHFLIEVSLGLICSVMAFYGWNKGMLIVAVPCAAIAVSCLGLAFYSVCRLFLDKLGRT